MRKFETDIRVIADNIGVSTDTIVEYVKRLYVQSTKDYYSIVKKLYSKELENYEEGEVKMNNKTVKDLYNDDRYYYVKSFRLSQAISFLIGEKPILIDNDDVNCRDLSKNPKVYFFKKTPKFEKALDVLLKTRLELREL